MTNFLLDFKLYMGHLARLHRELQDTPDERHYFFGDLPDFWANLRSEVNFPAMVAEYSEVNYEGGKSNVSKRRVTSFSIVDSYDQAGDVNEMVLKVSNCEKIAEEVLGRMIKDPDSEKPFRTIDIESITGEYNANEANKYVGYRINLTLTDPNICIYSANAWLPEPEHEPEEATETEETTDADS